MSKEAKAWIARQEASRQADLTAVCAAIAKAAPKLAVRDGAMLGFGPFKYKYASGREGDAMLVTVASTKTGLAVYVNSVRDDGQYVAEAAASTLGKARVGKSCIRFKKAADLDLLALEGIVKEAVRRGGAGQVSP